jgi:hypothetical protein
MEDIERKKFLGNLGIRADTVRGQLHVGERFVRISVMTAFVALLAIEAWLLWQVWQLF